MILNVLIYVTILFLILLFKSIIDNEETLLILSGILLFFTILFGWIVIGISLEKSHIEIKQTPIEILKGKHTCILVFETHTFQIEKYELEKVTNKSVYYYRIGYNMYNYTTDTTLIIK